MRLARLHARVAPPRSWYERVEPWTHVVPWGNVTTSTPPSTGRRHARRAARAARGRALAEGLTVQRTLEWWAHFLEEYAALQRWRRGDPENASRRCREAELREFAPDAPRRWDIGVPLCGATHVASHRCRERHPPRGGGGGGGAAGAAGRSCERRGGDHVGLGG